MMRGVEFGLVVGIYSLVILTHIKVKHIERTVDAIARAFEVEVAK